MLQQFRSPFGNAGFVEVLERVVQRCSDIAQRITRAPWQSINISSAFVHDLAEGGIVASVRSAQSFAAVDRRTPHSADTNDDFLWPWHPSRDVAPVLLVEGRCWM